jgi:hypothetical protein
LLVDGRKEHTWQQHVCKYQLPLEGSVRYCSACCSCETSADWELRMGEGAILGRALAQAVLLGWLQVQGGL